MKKILCIALLSGFFTIAYGQFKEPKFGRINASDLKMVKYEKDSTADALILFDNGYSYFNLNMEREFQIIFERHIRIKIFKKTALDLADFKIRLYQDGGDKENLTSIKGITYNLEKGKIVKKKLRNDNIFEESSKHYTTTKIAFPDVKEGSVIELSYTITSDFLYNLRGWNFQYKYPAVWSQYTYDVPEYFTYRISSKGYLPYYINKDDETTTNFVIHYSASANANMYGGINPSQNYNLNARVFEHTFATKDVPAFVSEPNIDCEDNYIQSINFELSSIKYPEQPRKYYTQSWKSVNEQMNKDEDFGTALKYNGFIKDTVANICKGKTGTMDKINAIYDYVQKRMKWNQHYSLWAPDGLKKPFQERTGNSSEINLLLTTMLRTAGLKADPVMFSTRDNGIAIYAFPTITKYNSVLSKVSTGDSTYILLDATNEYCPAGVLPPNDINGVGREVNNTEGDWVNLNTSTRFKEVKTYHLNIHPDGKFTGYIKEQDDGYAGVVYRNELSIAKSTGDFYRKVQEHVPGLNINGYSISNKLNNDQPFCDSLNVVITDQAESIGDKLFFQPLLFERIKKNRYTLEDRKYPVNYNYPITETYVFSYTIPDGYEVESVPQPFSVRMPDNSIKATFVVNHVSNKISVVYRQSVNKVIFLPNEYANLKQFYDYIVKKQAESIVLKKSANM